MRNRLSLILLLVAFLSFAQNKFEQGYYIDNSGLKTECLIKNYDWKNNPKSIVIKNSQDESIVTKTLEEVKEFSVLNKSKYIRETLKIDVSVFNFQTPERDPNPNFQEKTLFLKVLVEGKSNLYYFESESYIRYFYSNNGKIEQLIYKEYANSDRNISKNEAYKQQLFVNFKCNNDQKSIENLDYDNSLIDYFIKTNNCISGTTNSKEISEKRKFNINLKLNLLVNSNSQTYSSPFIKEVYESGNSTNLGFGFEAEIILPYNNGNWSVVMDPYYYKFDKSLMDSKGVIKFENITNVFKIPLGVRRYFSINNNSKFFANAALNLNLSKTKIDEKHKGQNIDHDMYNSYNFSFGVGYQYRRYNIEIKFNPKTVIGGNQLVAEEYAIKQASLKLGYRIL
jgi:hypothetical protein